MQPKADGKPTDFLRSLSYTIVSHNDGKRKREPEDDSPDKRRKVSLEEPCGSVSPQEKPSLGRSSTAPIQGALCVHSEEEEEEEPLTKRVHTTKHGQVLQVRHGDITTETTECIVNAANSSLAHGAGVAGAVRRAGGYKLVKESNKWVKENGEVPVGGVAWTSAGDMKKISYVIHSVGPIYRYINNVFHDLSKRDGRRGEAKALKDAVKNSLELAHAKNWSGISIPAISSGIFGFPSDYCAEIMFDTALDFISNYGEDTTLKIIRFTNFDSPTVNIFCEEFDRRFTEEAFASEQLRNDKETVLPIETNKESEEDSETTELL